MRASGAFFRRPRPCLVGNPALANPSSPHESWCILVLPFMEQQPLYDSFNRTLAITDAANAGPRSAPLPVMLCPSDAYNRQPFMGEQGETKGYGDNWARGNYGANASLGMLYTCGLPVCAGGSWTPGWKDPYLRGVMGATRAITFAGMTDGASNTVLLGELRAGITPYDPRGVWARPAACSTALWGHGGAYGFGDDYGPNNPSSGADNTMNCTQLQDAFGGASGLAAMAMPCYDYGGYGANGSQHAPRRRQHLLCRRQRPLDQRLHPGLSQLSQPRCPSGTV